MLLKYNLAIFTKEVLLVGVALLVGIFSAFKHYIGQSLMSATQAVSLSWWDAVLAAAVFLIFSLALMRSHKLSAILLKLFFIVVVFSGTQFVFEVLFPQPWGAFLTLVIVGIVLLVRSVLTHDVGMLLGIAGLSSVLGLSITPLTGTIVLAVFAIYDVVAVYRTHHMVRLAESMIQAGTIFGFIIPAHWRDFLRHSKHAQPGEQFMILGSGDIGLPIVFAASMVSVSVAGAGFVAMFSLLGLFATHMIFTNQRVRRPMAALPPIATATIIGYGVFLLFM